MYERGWNVLLLNREKRALRAYKSIKYLWIGVHTAAKGKCLLGNTSEQAKKMGILNYDLQKMGKRLFPKEVFIWKFVRENENTKFVEMLSKSFVPGVK